MSNNNDHDALFAVFGSTSSSSSSDYDDDDCSCSDDASRNHKEQGDSGDVRRPHGVLTFHEGTEQALWCYVQQQQQQQQRRNRKHRVVVEEDPLSQQQQRCCRRILESIDEYCWQRHWMMHVGPSKGKILQDFLQQRLAVHHQECDSRTEMMMMVVVELGTYCGYSLITMAETLLAERAKNSAGGVCGFNFCIFTVDVNPQTQTVARRMVELAGLSEFVEFVLLDTTTPGNDLGNSNRHLSDQLISAMKTRGLIPNNTTTTNDSGTAVRRGIDFVLVDHAKEWYLPDLQQLERTGLIRAGTAVAADNVVFFQLDEYRQHLQQRQRQGIVTTQLVQDQVLLEYCCGGGMGGHPPTTVTFQPDSDDDNVPGELVNLQDGMELTVYLKDPPAEATGVCRAANSS